MLDCLNTILFYSVADLQGGGGQDFPSPKSNLKRETSGCWGPPPHHLFPLQASEEGYWFGFPKYFVSKSVLLLIFSRVNEKFKK